ncbi:MAG TPA: hypothetical protein VN868_01975 [Terriglobales bacterium]|nr:hypothetical protein [Terriglobales bacterium]
MQHFTNKYRDQINGTLSGFDRLVLRGSLRRLNYGYWDQGLQALVAQGMEQYLWQNHILFKDYLDHVKHVSQKVKQASVKRFESQGLLVEFLRDPAANKDEIARASAAKRSVKRGWCAPSAAWNPAPRSNTGALTWFAGPNPARWFTNTRSIRKWDGCMRVSRPGSRSTSRWG